jgi:hypothetical protein
MVLSRGIILFRYFESECVGAQSKVFFRSPHEQASLFQAVNEALTMMMLIPEDANFMDLIMIHIYTG